MGILWSLRLAGFLAVRMMIFGHDRRFAEIKRNTMRFMGVWFMQVGCALDGAVDALAHGSWLMQGVWIMVTALPIFLVLGTEKDAPIGWLDMAGAQLRRRCCSCCRVDHHVACMPAHADGQAGWRGSLGLESRACRTWKSGQPPLTPERWPTER